LKKGRTLERSKRHDAPKSSVVYLAQGSKSVSLMIDSTISTTCSLYVRRQRTILWVTRPVTVIKPLPAPRLSLGGDDFFGLSPVGRAGPLVCHL